MTELSYISVNSLGATYSVLPYYWTSETSVVFENLYLPIQETTTQGRNFITIGPGRFQDYGNGLDCSPKIAGGDDFHLYFGYYRNQPVPDTMYYRLDYTQTSDLEGRLEIGNAYMSLNGVILATGVTYTGPKITMDRPFYLFNSFRWTGNYIRGGRVGKIKFYENGVLAATYTPYLDDNGVAGFLDENNNTMIYSSDYAWVAGPPAKSIAVTALKKTLKSEGETIQVDVYCENSWTIEGQTFLTVSPTAGTGNFEVNVTAPSYTGTTARTDTLTFTDTVTGDEEYLTLKQKKYTSGQPVYLGADEIAEIHLGADEIAEAYLGEVLVFSTGPFQGLKITPSSISFNSASLTGEIKVKSSETWTMTVPSWISASVLTGGTGETIVSLTATTQTAAATDTISITTANYSGSVTAIFHIYEQLSYIYATDHSSYVQASRIDTGIEHTASTMTVEIEYYGLGNSDRMVGYQQGDAGCSSDSSDFRLLGFNGGYYDYMNYRNNVANINQGYQHLTIGDCFCYNNQTEQYLCQGSVVGSVPSPNCHILVDVSLIKVKSVKIKDGSNVLFDGVAAKLGNDYGLFDRVSGQLVTNSNVSITGEQ